MHSVTRPSAHTTEDPIIGIAQWDRMDMPTGNHAAVTMGNNFAVPACHQPCFSKERLSEHVHSTPLTIEIPTQTPTLLSER